MPEAINLQMPTRKNPMLKMKGVSGISAYAAEEP
jgi:hypothetical protein